MSARTINELEQYCGKPIYSLALAEDRPSSPEPRSLVAEACDLTEVAARFQGLVRAAVEDGQITQAERLELGKGLLTIEDEARTARAALEQAPGLQAVA